MSEKYSLAVKHTNSVQMCTTGQLQSLQLVPLGVKQLLTGAKLLGTDQQTSSNGRK
jgi:hypothetical protein